MMLALLLLLQGGVQELDGAALAAMHRGDGRFLLTAPADFRSVGLWSRESLEGGALLAWSAAGQGSTSWPLADAADLAPEAGAAGPAGRRHATALLHFPRAEERRLVLQLPPAQAAAALAGELELAVAWIAAGPSPRRGGAVDQVGRPAVWSRSSWGARPPQCGVGSCPTTHVAMHHTASAAEFTSTSWAECAANVRATQDYHMLTRGWCDIGYHYLVCPHGDIFEGRAGGDDVVGAHDGWNCGSMAIALMGWFHDPHDQVPTPAMEDAYVDLAAWKCDQQGIDPLASAWYAGYGGIAPTLYGHRDVSSTACPGDLAHALLPSLRLRVEARLSGGAEIVLDNEDASYVGAWNLGTTAAGRYGADYRWTSTGTAPARATWQVDIAQGGTYEVALWWPAGANRNPSTRVGFLLDGRLSETRIDQQQSGGRWVVLGQVPLAAGARPVIGLDNSGGAGWVVVADALRLRRL